MPYRELNPTVFTGNVPMGVYTMRFSLVLMVLAVSTVAFAQQDWFFQVGYAANLNIGDSVVNLSNDGRNGGVFGATPPTVGNICANVYVFDPQEEEIGCCSCLVTPNGLNSLSVKSDLISNNLTPAVPTSVIIKVLGSLPAETGAAGSPYTVCNPATANAALATALTPGLLAWGTTLEPSSTPGTYNAVDVPYLNRDVVPRPVLVSAGQRWDPRLMSTGLTWLLQLHPSCRHRFRYLQVLPSGRFGWRETVSTRLGSIDPL